MTTLKQLKQEQTEMEEGIMSAIKKVAVPAIAGVALAAGASQLVHADPEATKAKLQSVSAHTQQASETPSAKAKLADMRAKFASKQPEHKPL